MDILELFEMKQKEKFITKYESEEIKYRKKESNIPSQYWCYKWDDYKIQDTGNGKILPKKIQQYRKKAKNICLAYAKNINFFHKQGTSLIIIGKRTSGKSVLGVLILKTAILKMKENVLYVSFSQMAQEMFTGYFDEHTQNLYNKYVIPEFLMIDEIQYGFEIKQKTQLFLSNILNERLKNNKPTIITSKINMNSLERMLGSSVFNIITNQEYYINPINILTNIEKKNDFLTILNTDENLYFDITKLITNITNVKISNKKKKTISKKELLDVLQKGIYNG